MSKFNIGDKVEVVDEDSWYYKIFGVIFSITVDGRYLVGFPNTDYEPFIGCQLSHHYDEKEPTEPDFIEREGGCEPIEFEFRFDMSRRYEYLDALFPIFGSKDDVLDSFEYLRVWKRETPPFISFICTDEHEDTEEPEELSTTMENLYDIIDHVRSLKDSGAQSIRVTIDSEKETEQGFIETYNSYKWECDLDE